MAFVVEDGTGVAGANSYQSVDQFRAYHGDRGRPAGAGNIGNDIVEAVLIRGTDYVEKRWVGRWIGTGRLSVDQGLSWPRVGVVVDGVPIDGLPLGLAYAVCEYGWRALEFTELAPDPPVPFDRERSDGTTEESAGRVASKGFKVGPIEEDVSFSDSGSGSAASGVAVVSGVPMPAYPAADALLAPLVINRSRVIRA